MRKHAYLPMLCGLLLAGATTAAIAQAPGSQVAALPAGEQVFTRNCGVCHSEAAGQNKMGPSLAHVVGRRAGSEPGFAYSPAMKSSNLTWDAATLDRYLADPRAVVPGTKMMFAGLKNPAERQALIQALSTH